MIKCEVGNGKTQVRVSGNEPEIAFELIRLVQAIREGIKDASEDSAFAFDYFLKDVFVDLVFAGDDADKSASILAESVKRFVK